MSSNESSIAASSSSSSAKGFDFKDSISESLNALITNPIDSTEEQATSRQEIYETMQAIEKLNQGGGTGSKNIFLKERRPLLRHLYQQLFDYRINYHKSPFINYLNDYDYDNTLANTTYRQGTF